MGSRFAEMLKGAARQIISVLMIFFGSLLALNVSVGPCGGTVALLLRFPSSIISRRLETELHGLFQA
jgi:hypothetical protein